MWRGGVEITGGGILYFDRNLGGLYFFAHDLGGGHLFRPSLVLFRVTRNRLSQGGILFFDRDLGQVSVFRPSLMQIQHRHTNFVHSLIGIGTNRYIGIDQSLNVKNIQGRKSICF